MLSILLCQVTNSDIDARIVQERGPSAMIYVCPASRLGHVVVQRGAERDGWFKSEQDKNSDYLEHQQGYKREQDLPSKHC